MKSNSKIVEEASNIKLDERSRDLRKLILRAFKNSGKGHVGSAFSMLEIMRVLYDSILNYENEDPSYPDRDRLIISPGWASLAQFALLADKHFFEKSLLSTFMNLDSPLGGCSEELVPGVEATTGACGHGLSIGIGMALSLKLQGKNNCNVFVVLGDGEHGEGSVWEAAISASKNGLNNLVIIIDYNKVQCSGPVKSLTSLEPLADKWISFGMNVTEVNGHDVNELKKILASLSKQRDKVNVLICHTVMGKGITFGEDTADWHWKGKLDEETINQMYDSIEGYK
jgi:transketolase